MLATGGLPCRLQANRKDVDPALFWVDHIEQTVEVVQIAGLTRTPVTFPAEQLDGLVELLLPPARCENVSTFSTSRLALASARPLDLPIMSATLL